MMRFVATGLAAACWLIWAGCGNADDQAETSEQTRAIMHEIFEEMSTLLPLSVEQGRLADPAVQGQVRTSLAALSRNAGFLERHTARKDAQMRYLARSISADAREVERVYQEQRYDRASFLLQRITENCVACHTRLPSQDDSGIANGFVDESVFETMELESRAALQMATRRFEAALGTLEQLLASPNDSPVLMISALTDYLVLAIRVKGDYDRPIPTLKQFSKRKDLWTQLRSDVEAWVDALPSLKARAAGRPTLATARALLDEGQSMVDSPADRAWLVHFVVASSILQRYIDTHTKPDAALAEAYYLLGTTEARIGRNYWVTPAPFLLETSIRLAPGEPSARRAFALLEQELIMSYEGVDDDELPADELRRLNELKRLVGEN